jgi:uncharacterized protein YoxC
MSVSIAGGGVWLLQATATAHDTLLMKTVSARNWFDTATSLASIVISIALIVLAVGLLPAAWNFRKSYKKISDLLDRVYGDVHPLVRHAHTIADNLDYVSTSIRVDIQQVSQTIATANERLLEAVRATEQRVHEFNALLGVVQEEAEDVFVSTASTLRGVRGGAAAFKAAAKRRLPDESNDGAQGDEHDYEQDDEHDDLHDDMHDDMHDSGPLDEDGLDAMSAEARTIAADGGVMDGEHEILGDDETDDETEVEEQADGDDSALAADRGREQERPRIKPRRSA